MKNDHKIASLRASLVSSLLAYAKATGTLPEEAPMNPDLSAEIGRGIDNLVSSLFLDETCWPRVKGTMLYDIYLEMREAEGTITDFDRVRPGLKPLEFASTTAYHEHQLRAAKHSLEISGGRDETQKTCSSCGNTKSISCFRKGSGAVCNTCRSRRYRAKPLPADALPAGVGVIGEE